MYSLFFQKKGEPENPKNRVRKLYYFKIILMNFKNKARVMLSGIAVMAVIGGAFALNAKRDTDKLFVRGSLGTNCTVTVDGVSFSTTSPTQVPTGITFITDIAGATCPNRLSYYRGQ